MAATIVLAVASLAIGALAPRLWAQAAASQSASAPGEQPSFEVSSIKVNKSGSLQVGVLRQPGGRFVATNSTLRNLIADAYRLFPLQQQFLVSGPSWIDSEHFDIEARAEGNPTLEEERLMLQSLLADRFKLVIHHETRQLPVYDLVLVQSGKTGPQLIPDPDRKKCADPAAARSTTGSAAPPLPGCSRGLGTLRGGRMVTNAVSTMNEFAQSLMVDRLVRDRTGLNGDFDIRMEFAPEATFFTPRGLDVQSDPSAPTFVDALKQQLGLKLESTKAPVDVLVIDHIEEPTPN